MRSARVSDPAGRRGRRSPLQECIVVGRGLAGCRETFGQDGRRDRKPTPSAVILPTVRGDFLATLARVDEARPEFERAELLTHNAPESELHLEHARARMTNPWTFGATSGSILGVVAQMRLARRHVCRTIRKTK
jgi:hypothetical protein